MTNVIETRKNFQLHDICIGDEKKIPIYNTFMRNFSFLRYDLMIYTHTLSQSFSEIIRMGSSRTFTVFLS